MKKLFRALSLLSLMLISLFTPLRPVSAASYSITGDITYDMQSNGNVVVTESYVVTNNITAGLDSFTITTPGLPKDISARNLDGGAVSHQLGESERVVAGRTFHFQTIILSFERPVSGAGKTMRFTVSYLIENLARGGPEYRSLFVPSIAAEREDLNFTVTVKTPLDFGLPRVGGDISTRRGIDNGKQFFSFTKDSLPNQTLAMQFGKRQAYRLNLKQSLKNETFLPRSATLTLPPDLHSQKVYLESLAPQPRKLSFDSDGNLTASYFLWPRQTVSVEAALLIDSSMLPYDTDDSGFVDDMPSEISTLFTVEQPRWQFAHVKAAVDEVSNADAAVITTIEKLFTYVRDTLPAASSPLDGERRSVETVLKGVESTSPLEQNDVLLTMLRSRGIPARLILGATHDFEKGEFLPHVWTEAYVPEVGWIALDPVQGKFFDTFGVHTPDHIGLLIWGTDDDQPPLVRVGKQTSSFFSDAFALELFNEELPKDEVSTEARVRRLVLLPFVSLERITVDTPGAQAQDNLELNYPNGEQLLIGSVPPRSHVTYHRFIVGSRWNQGEHIQLTASGTDEVVRESDIVVSYLPMIILLSALILLPLLVRLWRRFRSRRTFVRKPKDQLNAEVEEQDLLPPEDLEG